MSERNRLGRTPAFGSRWRYARPHRRWGGRVLTVLRLTSWGALMARYDGARYDVCIGGVDRFFRTYEPHDGPGAPLARVSECREVM